MISRSDFLNAKDLIKSLENVERMLVIARRSSTIMIAIDGGSLPQAVIDEGRVAVRATLFLERARLARELKALGVDVGEMDEAM